MNNSKSKLAIIVSIVLMLSAFGWGLYESRTIDAIKKDLNSEKLGSEVVLSEKLHLEKELEKTKAQMASLKRSNEELDRSFAEADKKNADKDAALARSQRENASSKKKYNELAALKTDLENQLASLNNSIHEWQLQNEDLTATVALLQHTNQTLKEELSRAHLAYYDKPLLEPLRGKKDKLMVKASRTQRLKLNIMIPSGLKEIQFKVIDPNGNVLSAPDDGTLAVRVVNSNINSMSSSEKTALAGYKQMEMVYMAKRKLQPGIYQIEVLSDNLEVGSLQVRLR